MSDRRSDNDLIVESSGDVFHDLEINLSHADRLKIGIAREISRTIECNSLTQVQAAEKVGCNQSQISNIVRGKLKGFTVDRLLDYLVVLGMDVDVHLTHRSSTKAGTVTVHPNYATG